MTFVSASLFVAALSSILSVALAESENETTAALNQVDREMTELAVEFESVAMNMPFFCGTGNVLGELTSTLSKVGPKIYSDESNLSYEEAEEHFAIKKYLFDILSGRAELERIRNRLEELSLLREELAGAE